MFIARMLSGLTGGDITVARTYIADVTDAQNRAKGMGLIGAAFSYLLAHVGLLPVIVQSGLIGRLTKRFSESKLIAWGVVIQGLILLAWAFTPSVAVLLVVLIPTVFSSGVLNTVINSAITRAVLPHEVGGAPGTSSALESMSRIISPGVGGWLLGTIGAWVLGMAGAGIMTGVSVFVWRVRRSEGGM